MVGNPTPALGGEVNFKGTTIRAHRWSEPDEYAQDGTASHPIRHLRLGPKSDHWANKIFCSHPLSVPGFDAIALPRDRLGLVPPCNVN